MCSSKIDEKVYDGASISLPEKPWYDKKESKGRDLLPTDRVFITPPQPVAFVVKEGNAPELRDESLEALLAKANEMTGGDTEVQEVRTISDAEYEAWKKHCSGQTLTNEEHSLLYRQGGQIPKEFIDDCNWLK